MQIPMATMGYCSFLPLWAARRHGARIKFGAALGLLDGRLSSEDWLAGITERQSRVRAPSRRP
jgi:hypothetical protein